ncbi:Alpha/Beta hydrolase protein [Favolaschia claudopus]|uniref:Alpha/Beta hydrolase protein n=1 Tax=Favolaschia claudopus TaxID=2862362 RepID=A0AAW0B9X9_9AGAR
MAESTFKISVSDDEINELRQKLRLTRFPDELDDAGWDYGAPLAHIRRLVDRWQNEYDWKAHEAQINAELPQFTRPISVEGHGTLTIHYVHQKSTVPDAIPLLFVHGWPGNFLEIRKILPLLVQSSPEFPSFHVVALGLPGYGWSEAPKKKGFRLDQYAEVGNKLMLALGYPQYVTQGGDLGFQITRRIAKNYGGKHSKAWHTNFPIAIRPSFFASPVAYILDLVTPRTEWEKAGLARSEWFEKSGRGYYHEHSTKPQTLGYSLADSPVGLLAWLYEKFIAWTDDYPWDDDEILTWVSSYYFSGPGPAASLRIYYELHNGDKRFLSPAEAPTIPYGMSYFPKDVIVVPRIWKRLLGNVVFEAQHEEGGHFISHEKPELLVGDVRKMFGRNGPAFGVVPGKTGYA